MEKLYKAITILKNIEELSANQTECFNDSLLKLGEEVGELMGAYLDCTRAGYKGKTQEDIADEIADVIQASLKLAFKYQNITNIDMLDVVLKKNKKWKAVSRGLTSNK